MLLTTTYIVSLASLTVAASAIAHVEFEYYPPNITNCQASELSALIISHESTCYNLEHPAISFHIGGPSTEHQVPTGLTIVGYADRGCKGIVNLQVMGPSNESACYIVGINMGQRNPVNSVVLECD